MPNPNSGTTLEHSKLDWSDSMAAEVNLAIDSLQASLATSESSNLENGCLRLDRQLKGLDIILELLQQTIVGRKDALKKQHNSIAPIHQLPVEILAGIFAISVGKRMDMSWRQGNYDVTDRLLELSSVAKHWRDVLFGTPQLWTTIGMGRRHTGLALKRSRELPLHIDCSYINPTPEVEQFIKKIKPHSHRWMSVRWQGDPIVISDLLNQHPSPLLAHLDLDAPQTFPESLIEYSLSPHLRSLRLCGITLRWLSQGMPPLRNFTFTSVGIQMLPHPDELITFLAACPALENIRFDTIGYDRDPPPLLQPLPSITSITTLSKLSSISFHCVMETLVLYLIQSIRADNLTKFGLDSSFEMDLAGDVIMQALTRGADHGHSPLQIVRQNVPGELYLELLPYYADIGYPYYERQPDAEKGIFISVPYTAWRDSMGSLVNTLGRPTRLLIGRHPDGEQAEPTDNEFTTLLSTEWMSDVTHIYLRHYVDIILVLEALAVIPGPHDDRGSWLCPALVEVHLSPKKLDQVMGRRIVQLVKSLEKLRGRVRVFDQGGGAYHDGVETFVGTDLMTS